MKDSRLSLRRSTRRLNQLRLYAASKDKTVTQIVEDWVDRLPNTEIGNDSSTNERTLPEYRYSVGLLPEDS
ncbi:hypothetical protein DP117_25760 [Brasilonema sp. UFV-L1]|uniref:hypothetical protein n=1 Tax=Brasilonema sp. UFV-L1 TaxID=2234130 RepID=UPI001694BEDA|nr:hypothetical protein [Brasilonema sp. UFV-L1]